MSTPIQVARKPLQKIPRFKKEAPSSMAKSKPPIGAANAVDTPAFEFAFNTEYKHTFVDSCVLAYSYPSYIINVLR